MQIFYYVYNNITIHCFNYKEVSNVFGSNPVRYIHLSGRVRYKRCKLRGARLGVLVPDETGRARLHERVANEITLDELRRVWV